MKLIRNDSVILIISVLFIVFQIAGCGSEGSLYDTSTASITIATSSSSVEADGRSSVTITATVTDVTGNSVPAGTPVNFSTNMGHFANGGQHVTLEVVPGDISQITSPRGGSGISGGGTNDGTAQVSLISSTEYGTAEITVESLGVTQFAYINFTAPLIPGHPTTISLVASSESIASTEFTTITATVLDKLGEGVLLGIPVTFTTTVGAFGNGQKSETAVTTTTAGEASVILFGNGEAGTAIVNAVSEGIPSNPVTVTITAAETTETTETTTTTAVTTATTTTTTTTVPRDDTSTTTTTIP